MEQPPGSIDDLQPQDLSTSSIPAGIDLSRKGEECVLNATSLDALRIVKTPGWYANSASSNQGFPSSDTGSSHVALQSAEHVQPDNAFSRTTVTLSYVSRSHVFSAQDSLSRHSPLCVVPPISDFSHHPSSDSEKGLGETGFSLDQHYLEQAGGPGALAIQPEPLQPLSQAQAGPEKDGEECLPQEPCEVNGGLVSSDANLEVEHIRGLENGRCESQPSSVVSSESSPKTPPPAMVEDPVKSKSEVLLLMSKKRDPVVVLDSLAAKDLCSLSREYISPLEDPVSPSATSLDDVEDVFILPQASSSPSSDNAYLEAAEEIAWDVSRTERAIQEGCGVTKLDSSDENKQPAHGQKSAMESLIELTDDVRVSSVLEEKPKAVSPCMNGNAKAQERTAKEKKLPWRSSRGTRLESIVMNINSSRYKVSGCIRTNKKPRASPPTAIDSDLSDPKSKNTLPVGKRKSRARSSLSATTIRRKAGTPVTRVPTNTTNTDSTSDSNVLSVSKKSHSNTPPKSPPLATPKRSRAGPKDVSLPVRSPSPAPSKRRRSAQSSPQASAHKNCKKEPEPLSHPEPSVEMKAARSSPPASSSPKKSPGKAKGKAAGGKASPTAKTKTPRAAKRRQRKLKSCLSMSMFSPKEPEIKLKYVNYKEEKRELRSDGFSPFIRIERPQPSPSLCTVVNYPEEVRTPCKKQQQQQQQAHPGEFISAAVPSTSCLQLGRVSTHSQHQRALVCCLCGQSANAMDLGDLHGPYYPEGYRPSTKTPASSTQLKGDEDGYSDSDSSSCSVRGRRRKCAVPPAQWPLRPGGPLKQKGLLESLRWSGSGSPAAKRARSDAGAADVEDWYSPPVLPLEPCEYWLHEDCGIWSAGVFLVKGKVYGLEEAVKTAQEMMCSACRNPGATLGCFFKGCPNKYHYRCALESECVLIEENFSMKCKKHKDKTLKGQAGNRCNGR